MCSRRTPLRRGRSAGRWEGREGEESPGEEREEVRQQLQAKVSHSLVSRGVNTADRWTPKPRGQLTPEEQARLERQRANKRRWARKERERCRQEMETLRQRKEKLEARNHQLQKEVTQVQKWKCQLKTALIDHQCTLTTPTPQRYQLVLLSPSREPKPKKRRLQGGEAWNCVRPSGSVRGRQDRNSPLPSTKGKRLTAGKGPGWKTTDRSPAVSRREQDVSRAARARPPHTHSALNIDAILKSASKACGGVTLCPQHDVTGGARQEVRPRRVPPAVLPEGQGQDRALQPAPHRQQLSEAGGNGTGRVLPADPLSVTDIPESFLYLLENDDDLTIDTFQSVLDLPPDSSQSVLDLPPDSSQSVLDLPPDSSQSVLDLPPDSSQCVEAPCDWSDGESTLVMDLEHSLSMPGCQAKGEEPTDTNGDLSWLRLSDPCLSDITIVSEELEDSLLFPGAASTERGGGVCAVEVSCGEGEGRGGGGGQGTEVVLTQPGLAAAGQRQSGSREDPVTTPHDASPQPWTEMGDSSQDPFPKLSLWSCSSNHTLTSAMLLPVSFPGDQQVPASSTATAASMPDTAASPVQPSQRASGKTPATSRHNSSPCSGLPTGAVPGGHPRLAALRRSVSCTETGPKAPRSAERSRYLSLPSSAWTSVVDDITAVDTVLDAASFTRNPHRRLSHRSAGVATAQRRTSRPEPSQAIIFVAPTSSLLTPSSSSDAGSPHLDREGASGSPEEEGRGGVVVRELLLDASTAHCLRSIMSGGSVFAEGPSPEAIMPM